MKKLFIITCFLLSGLMFSCKKSTESPLPSLVVSYEVLAVSADQVSDGAITLDVSGGKSPYSYSWSNGSSSKDLLNISDGIYTVTITDAANQTIVRTITITKIVAQFSDEGTVTDIDGNTYRTVKIGNQWWMAENLRVTKDAQGNNIDSYMYNDNSSFVGTYGRLYEWDAMMNGSAQEKAQGIAPNGWHIPSDAEWNELFDFLGGYSVAGAKMKSRGTQYWNAPNSNATNSSSFTSLPAGGGYPRNFEGMGEGTHYWSSSNASLVMAPTVHSGVDVLLLEIEKTHSISVRCIKD